MSKNPKVVCKTEQRDLGDYEFVEIMPIGDLHIGDAGFNKKYLHAVGEWLNEKPNRYTVIAGDVFNAALKNSVSDTYTETMTLGDAIDEFKKFVKIIGAEKIIGVVRGNHDNRVVKTAGLDPVGVACELTGIPYSGPEGFLSLSVGDWKTRKRRTPIKYLMYLTHGTGGGRTMGSKVNGVTRHTGTVIADIYVQGHNHTPMIIPDVVYVTDPRVERIVEKEQLFIITSSFTERDGYAKDFAFGPVSHKFPVIRLSGRRKSLEAELKDLT